jgi:hypothetical protein
LRESERKNKTTSLSEREREREREREGPEMKGKMVEREDRWEIFI